MARTTSLLRLAGGLRRKARRRVDALGMLVVGLLGCGPTPPPSIAPGERATPSSSVELDALIAEMPDVAWHYHVLENPDGGLLVEARLRGASSALLHVDAPADRYIDDLEVFDGAKWAAVDGLEVPSCVTTCRLRYRFSLSDAADGIGDPEVAERHHATLLSPPTAWLLRPSNEEGDLVFRVKPPTSFVTGLWPAAGRPPGTFIGEAGMFWRAPYSAFGNFREHRRQLDDATVEIAIATDTTRPGIDEVVLPWLDAALTSVKGYFGRFPVPRAQLIMLPTEGSRVHGKELGGGGASVLLWVGRDATRAALSRDWVLVHEMVHLAVPMMPYRFAWLSEGIATYVEPLARAQAGLLDEREVWRDMVIGMPKGQPERGDRGLDRTRTWGRLYWGGAMFALVADVEIRKRTNGAKGLQDALRGTLAAGGHNGVGWSIERFMRGGDEATGTTVLSELYQAWSSTPVEVDLEGLWRDLGVIATGRDIRFDDSAPLAYIRKVLTRPQ